MRGARSKYILVTMLTTLCWFGAAGVAQASAGITVTPATLTLNLVPDSQEQTATFTVTNHYEGPIQLRFSFEPRIDAPDTNSNPINQLSITQPDIILQANETTQQVITVRDNDSLSPGSHLADLVISQISIAGSNVSVQPSVRLSLVIVKQAGAVASLNATKVSVPIFGLMMPDSVAVTIHNKGNVITIPRGVVTISGPGGVARRGALNVASLAVSPGRDLAFETPLHELAGMRWPGIYRATVNYGLGGDQASLTTERLFIYVAWWHAAGAVLLFLVAYLAVQHRQNLRKKILASNHFALRLLLHKRGAS
jgi:hypothetical protein